jgi:hypothetical protein
MKAKLLHHASEWIPGDFEAPEKYSREDHLTVRCVHRDLRGGLVSMKLDPTGVGVWGASGRLLHFIERGTDLAWSREFVGPLSLESQFGRCRAGKGIRHALKRLEAGSFRVLDEMEVCVPTGGVEYLVINHMGDHGLATWLEQSEWGYVILDLRMLLQLPGGLTWPSATLAPPEYSLDDAFIVSCHFFRNGWWTDTVDDYWDFPSPGGLRKVGAISVHDVAAGAVSHHDVLLELPPGWMPAEGDHPDWNMIWGPSFVSDRSFHIWLPDESTELLTLPLPPQVEIRREIRTQRSHWSD